MSGSGQLSRQLCHPAGSNGSIEYRYLRPADCIYTERKTQEFACHASYKAYRISQSKDKVSGIFHSPKNKSTVIAQIRISIH